MKRITLAAWLSFVPLFGAIIWYWVLYPENYFPGRYEDAFLGTTVALLVAAPGALFLLFRLGYLAGQWLRRKAA
jgi:hypothetical protein